MTSGGTESLILACKAYKEFAKREKGVEKPNMVLPVCNYTYVYILNRYKKKKIKNNSDYIHLIF